MDNGLLLLCPNLDISNVWARDVHLINTWGTVRNSVDNTQQYDHVFKLQHYQCLSLWRASNLHITVGLLPLKESLGGGNESRVIISVGHQRKIFHLLNLYGVARHCLINVFCLWPFPWCRHCHCCCNLRRPEFQEVNTCIQFSQPKTLINHLMIS